MAFRCRRSGASAVRCPFRFAAAVRTSHVACSRSNDSTFLVATLSRRRCQFYQANIKSPGATSAGFVREKWAAPAVTSSKSAAQFCLSTCQVSNHRRSSAAIKFLANLAEGHPWRGRTPFTLRPDLSKLEINEKYFRVAWEHLSTIL